MKPIHIFRAGRHTSAGGTTLDFSDEALRASAAAYDPAVHEAPIVVGHPSDNAPAYGWVSGLIFDEGAGLQAEPTQVEAQFAEMVADGRFKKVSASFYTPESASNPAPGVYYLRHVGFLGAQPPAVKGLKPVAFAEDDEGVVEFADAVITSSLWRRLREFFIEKFGLESADSVIPDFLVQDLEAQAREPASDAPDFSETDPAEDTAMNEQQKAERDKLEQDRKQLEAEQAAFAEQQAALAKEKTELREREHATYVDALVAKGKVAPAEKARIVAFMATLDDEQIVEFAEGEGDDAKTVKGTALSLYRQQLEARAEVVDLKERTKSAPGDPGEGMSDIEIANRAVAYRERLERDGVVITTTQAVADVRAGKDRAERAA